MRVWRSASTSSPTAARSYRALAETERTHDELAIANEDMLRANVQIRAMHIAIDELLNVADERANGRMRDLIEETGDDLVALLRGREAPGLRARL